MMAIVCPTANRIVALSVDPVTVMVINRCLRLCVNCKTWIVVFWQSESLIRRTTVDRFFGMGIDRWLNGTVDRWLSLAIDRCFILCLVFSFKVTVACCYESCINSSGGRVWLVNSDWIIVDIMVYQC